MSGQQRILEDVTGLAAELARLRAENAELRKAKAAQGPFGLKVTDKGGVSVYGLGRFPVTLYRQQWERVLSRKDEILAFLEANAAKLAVKE
jgi:hypothetical protein